MLNQEDVSKEACGRSIYRTSIATCVKIDYNN